jgi:hypothetical protein
MLSKTRTRFIPLLFLSVFMMSSCGDVGVTKRRHLPGYHFDFVKNKKKVNAQEEKVTVADKQRVKSLNSKAANLPEIKTVDEQSQMSLVPSFSASKESDVSPTKAKKQNTSWELNSFLRNPVNELRKEKLNGELKRAVFNSEDEKHGWSVLSFISTGLGVVGLAMMITGLALLVSFIFAGGIAFWWIFALVGLLFGIAAMVTGIISMRQTGGGEKRGRGFAIAGMISGIVSLALGLVGLLWGLLYTVINNIQNNNN